jgi:phosphatidylglycerol:prolipoprotein diacylglycerol transferase
MTIGIGLDPTFAHLGPLAIGWHGVFTAVALGTAIWLGMRGARRAGFAEDDVGSVVFWAVIGGFVGARLFYYFDHVGQFRERPQDILAIWQGGIAVYGAFIGGVLAGWVRAWQLWLDAWRLLDVAAPAMLVGQAIGRIGCLLNGDAWGEPTGGEWGVVYTHPDALLPADLIGVPTHPYPLYEIGWDLLVLAGILIVVPRGSKPGTRFLVAVLGYALGRFILTTVRQEPVLVLGLQEAQVVALITGLVALGALTVRHRMATGTASGSASPDPQVGVRGTNEAGRTR